jgi:hypothetical protein
MKKYLLPGLVAVFVLVGLFATGYVQIGKKRPSGTEESVIKIVEAPHGRVLCVVVDDDGYYVGEEFIPFVLFRKYLQERGRDLKPDYAIVCGTESSRFGRAVDALDAVRAILKIKATMETTAIRDGTRRDPIEIREHFHVY